ncbi:DUF6194 family protein [Streptomyces sp. NBC_00647]|uniref:DUF6194 family protein n=1 Tax=Streptomyces sp. NBC_00647 TaxID=2975796 RepID=UPI00325077CB
MLASRAASAARTSADPRPCRSSGFDGVLAIRPGPDDGSPEISRGDTFFFYSPDGVVPRTAQPFPTIVTKNAEDGPAVRDDRDEELPG